MGSLSSMSKCLQRGKNANVRHCTEEINNAGDLRMAIWLLVKTSPKCSPKANGQTLIRVKNQML